MASLCLSLSVTDELRGIYTVSWIPLRVMPWSQSDTFIACYFRKEAKGETTQLCAHVHMHNLRHIQPELFNKYYNNQN